MRSLYLEYLRSRGLVATTIRIRPVIILRKLAEHWTFYILYSGSRNSEATAEGP